MTFLSSALAEIERARSRRSAAEERAGAAWNDTVFRQLQKHQLDPLEAEESRFISSTRDLDVSLDRLISRLRHA